MPEPLDELPQSNHPKQTTTADDAYDASTPPEAERAVKEPQGAEASDSPGEVQRHQGRRRILTFAVLLLVIASAFAWYLHSQTYEETDDAQVDGHIAPVSARVAGTVTAVYVQDDENVHVGQPLVELDRRTQAAAVEQSRARYEEAVAQLSAKQPNVLITQNNDRANISSDDAQLAQALAAVAGAKLDHDQAAAKVADAEAQDSRAQAEARRYRLLLEKQEVSREEYERYMATAASSDANLAAEQAALAASSKTVDQRKAQETAQRVKRDQDAANAPHELAIRVADVQAERASVNSAKAAFDRAILDLSFTKIVAPVSGIITQRSAEIGTRVSEGAQLMMIAQTNHLWVTANFKETQLRNIHPNQRVRIHIDALDRDFEGYIDSMPALTGARSSVLPPENATGNYVKVVQRLPIRIRFKAGQDGLAQLRLGMSAEPYVYLR
ncbi:MAG: HlyD family secretion protein [Acidobacteriaceae bacterium]